jgi:aminoglycoside phosphotransferase (APT) family kinase protein
MREARSDELRRVVLFGKIYHKLDKARQVYKEMQVLAESRAAREGKVILARPRVMIDELGMILQEQVNGDLLVLALDCRTAGREPRAVQGLKKAAEALSAVHYSGINAGRERSISRELSRFKHRARNIGRVNPALADSIIACADAQARRLEELDGWGAENTVVHGDCKPSQFLTGSSGTAILDFDHVGMADPAVDVGTFLATLRQMACRHAYRTKGRADPCFAAASELEDLFLSAYCEAEEVHSGFHYRAIWYESVGLVRKAIRSFERSPFSGLPMQLVSEAEHVLDRLTDGNSQTSSKI